MDMEPFFDNYKKVLPYFINDSPVPEDGRERQSPEQRARFDGTPSVLCVRPADFIPSYWGGDDCGPAALVAAHRFVFDSRDEAAAERMHIVSETRQGSPAARQSSTAPWPARDIQIAQGNRELKMASITGRLEWEAGRIGVEIRQAVSVRMRLVLYADRGIPPEA